MFLLIADMMSGLWWAEEFVSLYLQLFSLEIETRRVLSAASEMCWY